MIKFSRAADLNWDSLYRIAYRHEKLALDEALVARVDAGAAQFETLIQQGVPCYGVTTGLGQLVGVELDAPARAELPANLLRARAAAIGEPFARPVARAMLLIRLVNFISARSGVRAALCQFLVACLNREFTPWVPSLGHGMGADAIANTHAFQTLIGEGYVYGADERRETAAVALTQRELKPFALQGREGLALVNGVCAAPALATDAYYRLDRLLRLANLVAAVAIEALAAAKDAFELAVAGVSSEPGIGRVIAQLRQHLQRSRITADKLQAPVSYRVIPQVHGGLHEALCRLREKITYCLLDNSDNPLMDNGRLLSVGGFHNQHLVNQVEHLALALAHVGSLSERRLHRLLDARYSGLNSQLAARPGLDAGLVVTQKASVDLSARLRVLAQPVSLFTAETSSGQEDYMALAIPAIARLDDMERLVKAILAYELFAGLIALDQRAQRPGDGVTAVREYFAPLIAPLERDRPPGPDVETILQHFDHEDFSALWQ